MVDAHVQEIVVARVSAAQEVAARGLDHARMRRDPTRPSVDFK